MGAQFNVYVGPYLVVPQAEQEIQHPPKTLCTQATKKHKCQDGMQFCPHCGAPTEVQQKVSVTKTMINPHNFLTDDEAALLFVPSSFWTTNGSGQPSYWLSEQADISATLSRDTLSTDVNIDAETITRERETFATRIEAIRQRLHQQFGVTTEIRYGAIPYEH